MGCPDFGSAPLYLRERKPEFVYKVTKALLDHKNELEEMFVPVQTLSKEMAAQALGAPLHDGSVKYFQEIGILKK